MRSDQRNTKGFTLVELLVALLLGGLLLLGVIQVFDSSRQGSQVQRALASVQDSGRIAIEFLSRDIRNADFSGCLADKNRLSNLLDIDPMDTTNINRFYELGSVVGDTADAGRQIGATDVIEDSDILQLVGARPYCDGVIGVESSLTTKESALTLVEDGSGNTCDIPNGTVLLVASCFNADIFMKTGGTDGVIEHSTAEISGLSNLTEEFSVLYEQGSAFVYKPYVYTYFLAAGANGNTALFRREDTTTLELIPNVDDFQVVFGVDSDSDGFAETFVEQVAANSVTDSDTIVSVKATLTVRSANEIDGAPIRRTYTATTNIRNRTAQSVLEPQ